MVSACKHKPTCETGAKPSLDSRRALHPAPGGVYCVYCVVVRWGVYCVVVRWGVCSLCGVYCVYCVVVRWSVYSGDAYCVYCVPYLAGSHGGGVCQR